MGTSHRHTPTVKGEPNWGKSSSAVTGVTKDVDESNQLNDNPPPGVSPSNIAKRQSMLGKRITTGYHHAVRNLVRAGGGRHSISNGRSRAIGHSGIFVAGGFALIFNEIASNGLLDWLRNRGFTSLSGLSCHEILDIIKQYCEADVVGLDETAANEALEAILDSIEERVGDDIENLDEMMRTIVSGDELKDMIDMFFGMYIFSHLSQNFEEKLEYERGSVAMKNAMNEIKDQIMDDIRTGRSGRSVESIDWGKPEGNAFIKGEFNRILFILQGNED
ncbi:MAG: hypothetical protein MJZ17_00840 [Bacteroidales bacterium]|nr:hypothetical protein [Bacteroidales bacterium]